MNNMKKWYQKIDLFMVVLVIFLIIAIYCYAQLKIFNKDYINFCGYTIFRVITGSMADVINPQDIVIVKITNDVAANDIITYKSGNDFITHRIIEKNQNYLITRGDANTSDDKPISESDIVGKVVFIINNVAIWIKVFTTPQIIVAIIFSIIAIKFIIGTKQKNIKNTKR